MVKSHIFTYRSGGIEQTYLKLAMLRSWDGRCCWCTASVGDTAGFELDHVIPESVFDEYKSRARIPISFDVHDVENLAPIHGGGDRHCNQRKSNAVDKFAGAIDEISLKAQGLAAKVRGLAEEMLSAEGFERSVLKVLAASMPAGSKYRASFEANAPMLIARVNAICPDAVDQSERSWPLWKEMRDVADFYCFDDVEMFLSIELDPMGRAAKMIGDSYGAEGFDLRGQLMAGASEIVGRLEEAAAVNAVATMRPRFDQVTLRLEPSKKRFRFVMRCFAVIEWDTTYAFESGTSYGPESVTSGWFTVNVSLNPDAPSGPHLRVVGDPDVWTMSEWDEAEGYLAEHP